MSTLSYIGLPTKFTLHGETKGGSYRYNTLVIPFCGKEIVCTTADDNSDPPVR